MISESHPWKSELKRLKRALLTISQGPLPDDIQDYKIEKPLLYSAIIMRRLIECNKISDRTRRMTFSVHEHLTQPSRTHALLRRARLGRLDKEFILNRSETIAMDIWNLSNEVLHSGYMGYALSDDMNLTGIYVSSIRNHPVRLLHVDLSTYFEIIDTIVADEVSEARFWLADENRLGVELS